METLPSELVWEVLSRLGCAELLRAEAVDRRWRSLAHSIWKQKAALDLTPLCRPLHREKGDLAERLLARCGSRLRGLRLSAADRSVEDIVRLPHPRLSPTLAQAIARHCPRLTSLRLSLVEMRLEDLDSLLPAVSQLEELDLSRCLSDSVFDRTTSPFDVANADVRDADSQLAALFTKAPGLHRLDLSGNDLNGRCLASVPEGLTSLRLDNCDAVHYSALLALSLRAPGLRELRLNDLNSWDGTVVSLGCLRGLRNLERLELRSYEAHGDPERVADLLRAANFAQSLKHLDLTHSNQVTKDLLGVLIKRYRDLEVLRLGGRGGVREGIRLPSLKPLTSLRQLSLDWLEHLSDLDLDSVIEASSLQSLSLHYLSHVSFAKLLDVVRGLPALTRLNMTNGPMSPQLAVFDIFLMDVQGSLRAQKDRTQPLVLLHSNTVHYVKNNVDPALLVLQNWR